MSGTDDGVEPRREKLIEAKQRWAREGRLLTGAAADPATRLPPGQHVVRDWPVLDLGVHPEVDADRFRLDLTGLVARPLSLTLPDLLAFGQAESVTDIHCVTQWSRFDNHWQGVPARALLEQAAPLPEVRHVILHALDGYTTNLRLDQFDQPGVLLVHNWEGKRLSVAHGGPVRVLVPRLYLWKSAKWIRRIEFVARDRPGFWETRGYHNNADPWAEERYS